MGQVVGGGDSSMKMVPEETSKRGKEELRELWRKAILQQILLQRMERENQKLQGKLNDEQKLPFVFATTLPSIKLAVMLLNNMMHCGLSIS